MATETKVEATFWEKLTDTLGAISEGIVGFLGRMFGSSNERIIRALGYIRPRGNDVHAVVAGSLLAEVNVLEPIMLTMSDAALKDLTRHFKLCLGGQYEPAVYVEKPLEAKPQGESASPGDSAEADGKAETPETTEPTYTLDLLLPDQSTDGLELVEDPLGLANLRSPAALDDLLPYVFAACREAARRTKNMRHFDVQIVGGIVLHRGMIAEMVTGEGKTLVATLPAVLNALTGQGVHVVTVNDYLARRDCEWMSPIYHAVGISCGFIQSDQDPLDRRKAYECDITYGTNSEFGFDYLRDNMKPARWADNEYPPWGQQVQRKLNYAIIDEVDNILIDEARTPLIISGPAFGDLRRYARANEIAVQLSDLQKKEPGKHFEVKEKERTCHLTDEGIHKAEELAGVESFYTAGNMEWPHLIDNSLKAHHLYRKDKEYVVMRHPESGEMAIIIVDEFTGRLMIGRQWSDGLHQAVEAKHVKEGVKIKEETQTLATITLQNFFKLYKKLAGMTGTAMTEASEFWKIYKLDTVAIPTNKPLIRENFADVIYLYEKEKWEAVVEEIERIHKWDVAHLKDGTEVIGTIRKETETSVEMQLKESSERRTITEDEVDYLERHGRPMLIGTTDVAKSEHLSAMLKRHGIKHELLNAKPEFAAREAEIVAQAGRIGGVTIATNMAGRGTDIILGGNPETLAWAQLKDQYPTRLDVPPDIWKKKVDDIRVKEKMEEEGRKVAEMGGLHIVGTERHEARRIDNQLRGRAGRQGDPGSGRFYLSLEDDLMRIFAGDWVRSMLERMGMTRDQSIESRMVSRRIESAQKKVEERNFDIRKNLLEYDEVMDHQRKRTYGYRQEILDGANCKTRILDMIDAQIDIALENFLADDYGPASFAKFASDRLSVECDSSDFDRSDFAEAETTAREKASKAIPGQIFEAMEENLSTDVDAKEWNWQAMAHAVNTRWGLKTNDRDLKKVGRDNLAPWITEQAEKAVAGVDLTKGADYLQPDWSLKSFCRWVKDKFQITLDPKSLVEKRRGDIKEQLESEIRKLYREKEIEFPVTVAMARFMSDRERSGPGGQRYDREGLYRWCQMRFSKKAEQLPQPAARGAGFQPASGAGFQPAVAQVGGPSDPDNGAGGTSTMVVTAAPPPAAFTLTHLGLSEDDFRTQSRAKIHEMLQGVVRKVYPPIAHEEIDARLDEAFEGADLSEEEDARELSEWVKSELDVEVPAEALTGISRDRARDLLWSAFDRRYRPEMRRMERSLVLNQLDATWKNHLYTMDHLRSGIGLVGYAQIDPKTEYKRQGMREFDSMWEGLHDKVSDLVFRIEDDAESFGEAVWAIGAAVHESAGSTIQSMRAQAEQQTMANTGEGKKQEPIRNRQQKVGRNDPCPCGSGKKYKNCCMRKAG